MPIRAETYALTRPVPYLLQRGVAQTISGPLRHGIDGSQVTVTESGSTVSVVRPNGTYLDEDEAISLSSSIPTHTLTPAATEVLGSEWAVQWSYVIGGETYPFRVAAYMCEWYPHNVISVLDLYTEVPELRYHIPQAQAATRGDGTGWQPQIDGAFYDFTRKLLDDGRPVWLVKERSTGVREWILARALQRCILAIPRKVGTTWEREEKTAYFRMKAAEEELKLRYSDEPAGVRRAGGGPIRVAPAGRPVW